MIWGPTIPGSLAAVIEDQLSLVALTDEAFGRVPDMSENASELPNVLRGAAVFAIRLDAGTYCPLRPIQICQEWQRRIDVLLACC